MKNKKVIALALAAALAITAIIPSAVANAASAQAIGSDLPKVSATSSNVGMLVTSGPNLLVTTGNKVLSSKEISEKVTFTTSESGVYVHPDTDSKKIKIYAEVVEGSSANIEDGDEKEIDLTVENSKAEFTITLYENSDESKQQESVIRFYDDAAKTNKIAEATYIQGTASKSGSGGGSGGGSGTSKTETLADGSKRVTTVVKTANGTVTTVVTTAKDGTVTTVKRVENKDGSGSVSETVKYPDGSSKTVELVTDKNGNPVSLTCSRTSASGATTVKTYSASGSKLTLTNVESTKTSLIIPGKVKIDGKTFKVVKIGASALAKNTKLKKISITKNVSAIGKNAFKGDSKLKVVAINGKVTSVGKNAFSGIYKKATFKIKASKKVFKTVKAAVKKQSGVAKTVKYKRV